MKRLMIAVSCGVFFFNSCGNNPFPTGKTIVEIGDHKITEGNLEFLASINAGIARQLVAPFGKKQIVDNLVDQELLYQASKKEGLDHDPQVKAKIELYKKVILAQSYVETMALKEAKKYYDANPEEFEQVKLAHIMVGFASPDEIKAAKRAKKMTPGIRTEEQALELANKVYDELKAGGDFVKLAKKYSEDPFNKDGGGSLGSVSKKDPKLSRRGFAPLLEKAFELKVGEWAGPIKTASGYHIITVTEPKGVASFEEAKNQLLFKARGEAREKLLAELKKKQKIVWLEKLDAPQPAEEEHPH